MDNVTVIYTCKKDAILDVHTGMLFSKFCSDRIYQSWNRAFVRSLYDIETQYYYFVTEDVFVLSENSTYPTTQQEFVKETLKNNTLDFGYVRQVQQESSNCPNSITS